MRASEGSSAGGRRLEEALAPAVYDELRVLAESRLRGEGPADRADGTSLVHDAYLRLAQGEGGDRWENTGHFFGAAAIAMRRLVVERARARGAQKRGGGWKRHGLTGLGDGAVATLAEESDERATLELELESALARLEALDERKARVVSLRYYAGLTNEQTAEALGVSVGTVKNDWKFARAWLRSELSGEGDVGPA